MDSYIEITENSLKKVQVLKARKSFDEALISCNKILDNLKPIALNISENTNALQLIAVTIGEISGIYENKNELQCSLEYKKLQRIFLSYIKSEESKLNCDTFESDECDIDKEKLIDKLNEIQNMTVHLSQNPEEAMNQILDSLQRSKEKKINSVLESLMNSSKNDANQNYDDIELTKFEKFVDFIFNHPFLFIFFIISFLLFSIFLITQHFQAKNKMPNDIEKNLKKISNYISKIKDVKDVKNPENIKKMMDL